MQTKKRAKPVKFGKAAKEAEEKKVVASAEEQGVEAAPAHEPPASAPAHAETSPQHGGELVDKLSDVPFETDFGAPNTEHEAPASSAHATSEPAEPAHEPEPAPTDFSATSTNPVEAVEAPAEPEAPSVQPVAAPIDVSPDGTIPPIGRANEPIPFNPHETVFNTPPASTEKKKNPFLYFLIIAFVAFVTGIAFMAGIYYAMPDKSFFAMPSLPAIPGAQSPSPTPAPVAQATATPAPVAKVSDYTVRVLNGSGIRGEAAKAKAALEADGFTVGTVGNADRSDVTKTQIVYKKTVSKEAVAKLKTVLGKTYALDKETELPSSASQTTDILITIGQDTAK